MPSTSSYKNPCRCVGLLASASVIWTPSTGATAAQAPSSPANGEFVSDSNRAISDDSSRFDGISLVKGDRVMVRSAVDAAYNGIYVVTDVGSDSRPWRIKRDDDANKATDFRVLQVIPIEDGASFGRALFMNMVSTTFELNVDPVYYNYVGAQGASVDLPLYRATPGASIELLKDGAGTLETGTVEGQPAAALKVRLQSTGPLYALQDFEGIRLGVDNTTIKISGTDTNDKPALQAHGTVMDALSPDDIYIGSGVKPDASGVKSASASTDDLTGDAVIGVAATSIYRGITQQYVTSGVAAGVLDGTWSPGEKVYLGVDGAPTHFDDLPTDGINLIVLGYATSSTDLFVKISFRETLAGAAPPVPAAPDFGVLQSEAVYTPVALNFNVVVSNQSTSDFGLGILNPSLALTSDRKRFKKLYFGGSDSSYSKLLPSTNNGLDTAVISEGFGPMENLPFVSLDDGTVYAFLPYLTAKFSPETQTWSTSLPAAPSSPVDGCAVVISATEVFLSKAGNKGGIFNTDTETWTETSEADVTWAGEQRCVVLSNGDVIVFGRSTDAGDGIHSVQKYVRGGDVWTSLTPMSTDRRRFGYALADNDIIVVAGGIDGDDAPLSSVESYDADTDTWTTTATAMSEARQDLRCLKLPGSDTTLIIWGQNDDGIATTIDAFNGSDVVQGVSSTWSDGGSQLVPRHSFSAIAYPLDVDHFNNQLTYNYELVIAGGADAEGLPVTVVNTAQSIDY